MRFCCILYGKRGNRLEYRFEKRQLGLFETINERNYSLFTYIKKLKFLIMLYRSQEAINSINQLIEGRTVLYL